MNGKVIISEQAKLIKRDRRSLKLHCTFISFIFLKVFCNRMFAHVESVSEISIAL